METRIAIIGAGIGGLTAGIALRQAGFDVHIYERAPQIREVGAAISLSPNALRPLRSLGLLDEIMRHAGVIERAYFKRPDGSVLSMTELKFDLPVICMHRADLQRVLVQAFPSDRLHLQRALRKIEPTRERVRAHFDAGPVIEADLLIGADGLRSVVREHIFRDKAPRYGGYTAWRGFVELPTGLLTKGEGGETLGEGVRMGIVPLGAERVGWWIAHNEPADETDEPEGTRAKLLSLCGGWHPPIHALITLTDDIVKTDIYDRKPRRGWSRGRVALLGDAAHPTTPNLGQGGCMAIEDAIILARCLQTGEYLESALIRYENARFDRTRMVATESRLFGWVGQLEHPLAARLRNYYLSRMEKNAGAATFLKYFDYDATHVSI